MAFRGSSRKLVLAISFGIAGATSALADQPFSPTSRVERLERSQPKASPRSTKKVTASRKSTLDASERIAGDVRPTSREETIDVVLDSSNTLRGRFVDAEGRPIDGAVVTLTASARTAARTTTDADGVFEIRRVPNGSYRLACGSAAGRVRCWNSDAAPPNALAGDVTFQDGVIRGQAAMLIPTIGTNALVSSAATAGAVVGGVAMSSTSTGNRSASLSGPPPGNEPPPTSNLSATSRTNAIVVPSDPFDPQVEYRIVDGRMVRVFHPESEAAINGFDNGFGDPRDQKAPVRITGDAMDEYLQDGFAPEESLPFDDDFGVPASP